MNSHTVTVAETNNITCDYCFFWSQMCERLKEKLLMCQTFRLYFTLGNNSWLRYTDLQHNSDLR